jgi:EAL domain-containing protein (putative c-di-GMP-specific phosphodiesterase class I)
VSGADAALLSTVLVIARARGLSVLGSVEKPLHAEAIKRVLKEFRAPARPQIKNFALTVGDLRGALDRDQLVVHYQPKVSLKTREISGFEALARWRHPEHGLVPPGQFIAMAENAGVIGEVTERIWALALRHCAAWNRVGLATKVSVNISAHLLTDLAIPNRLARDVWLQGLSPKQFIIEVTESGAFGNAADTLDILARLHMKGFALSIDDFGTGYSSMEQLRRVAFSELKIDRTFVHGATQNAKTRAILASSAALGKGLNLGVVAEGVETQEEWDLLGTTAVDSVQGFFVAKPMLYDQVPGWCEAWTAAPRPANEGQD